MHNVRVLPFAVAMVTATTFAGVAPVGADPQNFDVNWADVDLSAGAEGVMRVVLPDNEAEDAVVTANVKNAIAANIGPGAASINVETRVAVVTLTGQAATPEIRIRAREAAWIVSGVRDVIDRIEIKATA
jgi:BON domain-containing protein